LGGVVLLIWADDGNSIILVFFSVLDETVAFVCSKEAVKVGGLALFVLLDIPVSVGLLAAAAFSS